MVLVYAIPFSFQVHLVSIEIKRGFGWNQNLKALSVTQLWFTQVEGELNPVMKCSSPPNTKFLDINIYLVVLDYTIRKLVVSLQCEVRSQK